MSKILDLPVRLKILVAVLFVVTAVVSVITFTMANLFHEDKKTYINDLTSVVSLSIAEECRALLGGYRDRLDVYARIVGDDEISQAQKTRLVQELFADFGELISITVYENGTETSAAYNSAALELRGLAKDDLLSYRGNNPLPLDRVVEDGLLVVNSSFAEEMPSMTIAIGNPNPTGRSVVAAMVSLDPLIELTRRSHAFEIFILGPDGSLLAHTDRQRIVRHETVDMGEAAAALAGDFSAGVTTDYEAAGQEMIVGLARVDLGGLIAVAQIPKTVAFLASRGLLNRLILVALALLAAAALASVIWAHRLTRPVEQLSEATREIAKGQFSVQLPVKSKDEIGRLALSFNQMASELQDRDEALLETQAQLVQSEKMAAFGELGAGIAHEIKNPLAGILGCAQLSLRSAADAPARKNLQLIEKETRRCKQIIDNLLKFARRDDPVLEPTEINSVVRDAAAIVNHQLELRQVKLEADLASDLPEIRGNANQLQQVLMNLFMNAQQALASEPGAVTVATRLTGDEAIELTVKDTGPGIPEEHLAKIFQPFFTTKPAGQGTGLGLAVTYGIIQDHAGEIRVESQPGQGTTFVITLPVMSDRECQAPQEPELAQDIPPETFTERTPGP